MYTHICIYVHTNDNYNNDNNALPINKQAGKVFYP